MLKQRSDKPRELDSANRHYERMLDDALESVDPGVVMDRVGVPSTTAPVVDRLDAALGEGRR